MSTCDGCKKLFTRTCCPNPKVTGVHVFADRHKMLEYMTAASRMAPDVAALISVQRNTAYSQSLKARSIKSTSSILLFCLQELG